MFVTRDHPGSPALSTRGHCVGHHNFVCVCVGGTLWLLRDHILLKVYFDLYGHTGHNLVHLETMKWENNITPFFFSEESEN